MSAIFTSWKEIANYLGKGTRTVQRWERRMGLPVRRSGSNGMQVIFALQSEIDEWICNGTSAAEQPSSDRLALLERLQKLEAENETLRTELERLRSVRVPQTIVVVDDDQIHAYALRRLLEAEGYSVWEAHTGAEAMNATRTHNPDLVLLDVNLPDIDGFQVCRTLREGHGALPAIVFHTATSANEASYRRGMSAGATAFLSYPVPPAQLLSVIASSIANSKKSGIEN